MKKVLTLIFGLVAAMCFTACSEAYKASEKWGKFKIEEMPEENWWEIIP